MWTNETGERDGEEQSFSVGVHLESYEDNCDSRWREDAQTAGVVPEEDDDVLREEDDVAKRGTCKELQCVACFCQEQANESVCTTFLREIHTYKLD